MKRQAWQRLLPNYLILSAFLLLILLPIIGLVFSAFKTDIEVIKGPLTLPSQLRFASFKEAWTTGKGAVRITEKDRRDDDVPQYPMAGWACRVIADDQFIGRVKNPHNVV